MDERNYSAMPFSFKLARFTLRLRKAYPFLGMLCMRVEKHRTERYGLAATDGLRLYLNEARLNELPEEALNFILLHELFHIILRHRYPKGMPFYEKLYWNIGFDLHLNWLLMSMSTELKLHELPIMPIAEMVLSMDDLSKDTSNVIIESFIAQAVSQGILSDDPPLFVDIEWKSFKTTLLNSNAFIFDVLDANDVDVAPADAEIRELFDNCEKTAGKYGLPWRIRDLWDKLNSERKLPWHLILKRYLENMKNSDDFDFNPPDKRMLYSRIILPSETNEEGSELHNALVVIDVSSSIGRDELSAQIQQVAGVLKELEFHGSIISFGSEVYQEATLTDMGSLKRFIDGLEVGGGTDWSNVVRYVKQKKHHARPIIVFTDGYLFSFDEGLSDVIFITQRECPDELRKLGKVIKIQ